MKVGTDGVLLGAWFDAGSDFWGMAAEDLASGTSAGGLRHILDVGTGCGLIALMAAQRTNDRSVQDGLPLIDAIDIDAECCADAVQNTKNSPWSRRITVRHIAFDDFVRQSVPATFDRILSNPPYFNDSLLPPDSGRAGARHTLSLSPRQLARGAARLLAPGGLVAVILPPAEAETFISECAATGLHPRRRTEVCAFAHTPPKRVLLEIGFGQSDTQTSRLTIHGATPEIFTSEYRALTKDFYLKF